MPTTVRPASGIVTCRLAPQIAQVRRVISTEVVNVGAIMSG
jgi:hypothetical protein